MMSGSLLVCGVATMDWLASVPSYPQPDQKTRTTSLQKMCGGNAANAVVCVARLGIKAKILTKLGNDDVGQAITDDFKCENIDTSLVKKYDGQSSFSYIIIDTTNKSRTIINTPGVDLTEDEVTPDCLQNTSIVFLDGRHSLAAKKLAQLANTQNIPVILELENPDRPLIWDLLPFADYIVSSSLFPPAYLKDNQQTKSTDPFHFLFTKCPRAKWIISTYGKKGSVLIERSSETSDTAISLEKVSEYVENSKPPSGKVAVNVILAKVNEKEYFKVHHCSVWPCDPAEIIDTTGAGDTFNGGIIYSVMQQFSTPKMLKFATYP